MLGVGEDGQDLLFDLLRMDLDFIQKSRALKAPGTIISSTRPIGYLCCIYLRNDVFSVFHAIESVGISAGG
jgi:hypothetical protein